MTSDGAAGENFEIWHRFPIDFPLEIAFSVLKKLKIFRLRRANTLKSYIDLYLARRRRLENLTKI